MVYGSHRNIEVKGDRLQNGFFFAPIVLEEMNTDSQIHREETFGPVFNLFRVETSMEAMDLANKSDYGLSAAIFTKDKRKADAAAQRIRAGNVFINTISTNGSEYPSGGIKDSGYGKECYRDGLIEMGNRKAIIRDES